MSQAINSLRQFTSEADLQQHVAENFSTLFPFLILKGVEFRLSVGIIDIYAIAPVNDCPVFMELKYPQAEEAALAQACRYIGGFRHGNPSGDYVGIILAPHISSGLICATLAVPQIQLYELEDKISTPKRILCTCGLESFAQSAISGDKDRLAEAVKCDGNHTTTITGNSA